MPHPAHCLLLLPQDGQLIFVDLIFHIEHITFLRLLILLRQHIIAPYDQNNERQDNHAGDRHKKRFSCKYFLIDYDLQIHAARHDQKQNPQLIKMKFALFPSSHFDDRFKKKQLDQT